MGFSEYSETMIADMKNTITETIRQQMNYGWSFEQIEPLFDKAVKLAKEEFKNGGCNA